MSTWTGLDRSRDTFWGKMCNRSFIIFNQKSFGKKNFWNRCTGKKVPKWLFGKKIATLPFWHFFPCASISKISDGLFYHQSTESTFSLDFLSCMSNGPKSSFHWVIQFFVSTEWLLHAFCSQKAIKAIEAKGRIHHDIGVPPRHNHKLEFDQVYHSS